jgi:hypothetical protein
MIRVDRCGLTSRRVLLRFLHWRRQVPLALTTGYFNGKKSVQRPTPTSAALVISQTAKACLTPFLRWRDMLWPF